MTKVFPIMISWKKNHSWVGMRRVLLLLKWHPPPGDSDVPATASRFERCNSHVIWCSPVNWSVHGRRRSRSWSPKWWATCRLFLKEACGRPPFCCSSFGRHERLSVETVVIDWSPCEQVGLRMVVLWSGSAHYHNTREWLKPALSYVLCPQLTSHDAISIHL